VAPLQVSMAAVGGSGTITITASASTCTWNASSDSSWLSVAGSSSGSGSASVNYAVAASTSTSLRTGTLSVAGQAVTFTQAAAPPPPCTYMIAPTSATIGPDATTLNVAVTTQAGCKWTEQQDNDPWIQLGSVSSGTGSGTAQVDVERYKGNGQRKGTITIAGQTFSVTQTK
jgi:hypothetical protein